jgi:RNA polymerase sigma-70 factor, ECF subfamily
LSTQISDIELIKRVEGGDRQAFTIIVERYRRQVAKSVIGMLGNTPEADDVGQEVFIRFYQSIERFRGESSLGTYLTRIAINLSLNELKRRKRKAFLFFRDDNNTMSEINVEDADRSDMVFDDNELVNMALSKLEPNFRAIVVLRLIEGYSTKETAETLGLPQGTVLSRLSRAQEKLKEIMKTIVPDMVGDIK